MKPNKSVRVAAMDYLARREHARLELHRKLVLKGYDENEIVEALDRLNKEGLQDDRRFAESYVRHRQAAGFGPIHIAQALKEHGVAEGLIRECLDESSPQWILRCEVVWRKKFSTLPTESKARAKQQRFLLQRGFTVSQIQTMLAQLTEGEDEDVGRS